MRITPKKTTPEMKMTQKIMTTTLKMKTTQTMKTVPKIKTNPKIKKTLKMHGKTNLNTATIKADISFAHSTVTLNPTFCEANVGRHYNLSSKCRASPLYILRRVIRKLPKYVQKMV